MRTVGVPTRAAKRAPRGVRVNAVCPNDVDTPMLAGQARDYGGDDPESIPIDFGSTAGY